MMREGPKIKNLEQQRSGMRISYRRVAYSTIIFSLLCLGIAVLFAGLFGWAYAKQTQAHHCVGELANFEFEMLQSLSDVPSTVAIVFDGSRHMAHSGYTGGASECHEWQRDQLTKAGRTTASRGRKVRALEFASVTPPPGNGASQANICDRLQSPPPPQPTSPI